MFWNTNTATTASINCETKTSKEWLEEVPKDYGLQITDPDGWDRRKLEYSFNEELITKQHFIMRVKHSITQLDNIDFFKGDWANK